MQRHAQRPASKAHFLRAGNSIVKQWASPQPCGRGNTFFTQSPLHDCVLAPPARAALGCGKSECCIFLYLIYAGRADNRSSAAIACPEDWQAERAFKAVCFAFPLTLTGAPLYAAAVRKGAFFFTRSQMAAAVYPTQNQSAAPRERQRKYMRANNGGNT